MINNNKTAYYLKVSKIFGLTNWSEKQEELLKEIEWEGLGLDAGCGFPGFLRKYTDGRSKKIVNVDLGFKGKAGFSVISDLHHLPFKSERFNFIFCRFVMEHLENPGNVIQEFSRISHKEGNLLMLVPNLYSLVGLATSITPHWFHNLWRQRLIGVEEENAPTYNRANTVSKQKTLLAEKYNIIELARCDGWSGYFRFSKISCLLGTLFERLLGLLQFNRHSFWVWARKK